MKRFYCTICKRARRVRKFPANISSPNAPAVTDRTGTCVWHSQPTPSASHALSTRKAGAR